VTATGTPPAPAQVLHETVVQRLVFPVGDDGSTMPLYVECNEGAARLAELVRGRGTIVVPPGERLSFAGYFNAFPASYWRRWTVVAAVELRVQVTGTATVTVYRSNARGNPQRVTSEQAGTRFGYLSFELPLAPFGDGGWYWFEVSGGHEESIVEWAEWVVETERVAQGRVTVAITTFNRPADCVALLESLVAAEETMDRIDRVVVVDQGNQLVAEQPGFERAASRADGKVDIVRQPNLGGSGGFARGMYEAAYRGDSGYVLLLDDDVLVEPEGILRGLAFQDLVRQDTIVGGHMLNMFLPSMLHSFGEKVNRYTFMWGPAPHTEEAHDFAEETLRETEWMHRRVDVDYNGWWMCLIPTKVVREIGLALPVFIKWDDAEFGLRAKDAGIPTVSLPGMAVWHVPWTDKDDTTDWQAYYHARNRILMALVHSPYARGGDLLRHSLLVQLKHALAMEYSAAELRLWALEDILSGPQHLHRDLGSKLGEVRAYRAEQDDAKVVKDPMGFPPVKRLKPPKRGKEPTAPRGAVGRVLTAASGAARQLRSVKPTSRRFPEATVPAMDARWWLLSQFDSAVVSTADGTGAAWYKRDRERFNDIMRRSVLLHQQLLTRWNSLAAEYRQAVSEITGPDAWSGTWGIDDGG
jgi:galactofuranosylgalactofuranosylrhamnosyl-N-acetylglucosaminyl-diphospho-decaprenol beta-1,5/1,6-galactofuranosyltransferase